MKHEEKIEKVYVPRHKRKLFWPIIFGTAFVAFFLYMTISYYYKYVNYKDALIAEHIEKLENIFTAINQTCKITKFDAEKSNINFLNVTGFAGNTVGPMHLMNPEKWQGPYLKEELKVQDKPYQIVLSKKGYYIVPGEGVKLYNGKVMGKDIIINKTTNVKKLLRDTDALLSGDNKPLGAKVPMTDQLEVMVAEPSIIN